MRIARSKNSEENDQTVDDSDENLRIDLRGHLLQGTSGVHLRDSLDPDLCLCGVTYAQGQENRY